METESPAVHVTLLAKKVENTPLANVEIPIVPFETMSVNFRALFTIMPFGNNLCDLGIFNFFFHDRGEL